MKCAGFGFWVHLIYRQPISIFSSLHPRGSTKRNKLEKLKRGRGAIYWTKWEKVDNPSSFHPNVPLPVPEINDMVGNGPILILGPHVRLFGLVSLGKLRGTEVVLKSSDQESCALWPFLLSSIMLLLPSDAVYQEGLGFNCTLLQTIASEMVGAMNWLNALSHPGV